MGRKAAKEMQRTSATSRQAGFTLLELIVGLTVGSILLTAVYATFVGVSQTQQRVERVLDSTASWRYLTERLREDLNRIAAGTSFTGTVRGFEALFIHADGGQPLPLKYEIEDSAITRSAGNIVSTIELPAEFQPAVFIYQIGDQWNGSAEESPLGFGIRVATPQGQTSRTFALEFNPQSGQPQG